MPYQVTLTYVDGARARRSDIYEGPTPHIDDKIIVKIDVGTTLAQVTAVRKHPLRSPGATGEGVNDVDAQQVGVAQLFGGPARVTNWAWNKNDLAAPIATQEAPVAKRGPYKKKAA